MTLSCSIYKFFVGNLKIHMNTRMGTRVIPMTMIDDNDNADDDDEDDNDDDDEDGDDANDDDDDDDACSGSIVVTSWTVDPEVPG